MKKLSSFARLPLFVFFAIVFLTGTRATGQFTTVVEIPPDRLGYYFGSDTQVNLADGGVLPIQYEIGRPDRSFLGEDGWELIPGSKNIEVNIQGGSTPRMFSIHGDSVVNVTGGTVIELLGDLGQLNVSGGDVGRRVTTDTSNISGGTVEDVLADALMVSGGLVGDIGSDAVTVAGGDFRLNGEFVDGLGSVGNTVSVELPDEFVLTGTLSDSLPFIFLSVNRDRFSSVNNDRIDNLTLRATALADGPSEVFASIDGRPVGFRPGQTLHVENGGQLPRLFRSAWGSVVNVAESGSIGASFESAGSEIYISGGTVGDGFAAHHGSIVNISGGSVGRSFSARDSTINVTGGSIGSGSRFRDNSTVNISGGTVGSFDVNEGTVNVEGGVVEHVTLLPNSILNVSGGSVNSIRAEWSLSELNISGGEFRFNNVLINGLASVGDRVTLNVPENAILSGTLADGTPFIYTSDSTFDNGVTLIAAEIPPIEPLLITASIDPVPFGIRDGQTLRVDDGGSVPSSFRAAPGSTVNVEPGGYVGAGFKATDAEINISGGTIDRNLDVYSGSIVNITGGDVSLVANFRSDVSVSGGSVELSAKTGSNVVISGGTMSVRADAGSVVRVTGGGIAELTAERGDSATLVGGEFQLDGIAIDGLQEPGDSVTVDLPSSGLLTGALADGTPFALPFRSSLAGLKLEAAAVAPVGAALITASIDPVPFGIRAGQTLRVDQGGTVASNFVAAKGGHVIVTAGGSVGDSFKAIDAEVTIAGGSVSDLSAYGDSIVTISSGHYDYITANNGAHVSISGDVDGARFRANSGAIASVSGGAVERLEANRGSQVEISGGLLSGFIAGSGSAVTLNGAGFRMADEPIAGLENEGDMVSINVPPGVLLNGTLADGTPFAGYVIGDEAVAIRQAVLPPDGPSRIDASTDPIPYGVRDGQTLVVGAAAVVPHGINAGRGSQVVIRDEGIIQGTLNAVAAEVTVSQGTMSNINAYLGSVVSITSGSVPDLRATTESRVEISGGSIGYVDVDANSHISLSGGSVESLFVYGGGEIDISGGSYGWFNVEADSSATISGGIQSNVNFRAWEGSEVHILGESFFLDGEPIDGLSELGDSVVLDVERAGQSLTGTLLDGNIFRINLHSFPFDGCYSFGCDDYIDQNATLRLTVSVVPEPSPIILGCIGLLLLLLARRRGYASLDAINCPNWRSISPNLLRRHTRHR